ncbi:MAG TPA: hypothetical protein VNM90_03920 [Haliangium sp.]|nr:hypothetical protein [Haliangium sp.]
MKPRMLASTPRWLLVWSLLGLGTLAAPGLALADDRAVLTELQQREPTLAEVRDAALRHAGLDHHPERAWARRTRLAGLMPVLTVSLQRDLAQDADLSRESTGKESLDIGTNRDIGLEARAVWRLDRLLYDDAEVRALQMAQRQHQERLDLLMRVTSIYYQRRKLQLAQQRGGNEATRSDQLLAIEELTDQLDALTGGHFRRALHARSR